VGFSLHHASDKLVDEFFSVTPISTLRLLESVLFEHQSSIRRGKLESSEKVVRLLELRSDGKDLMDQVIYGVDAMFTD